MLTFEKTKKDNMKAILMALESETREIVWRVSNYFRNEAVEGILDNHGKNGNVYKSREPGKGDHTASLPGQFPASDTGWLAKNIFPPQITHGGKRASVTSHASYSVDLEFGTRYVAARPFFGPAALRVEKYAANNIKALHRAIARRGVKE